MHVYSLKMLSETDRGTLDAIWYWLVFESLPGCGDGNTNRRLRSRTQQDGSASQSCDIQLGNKGQGHFARRMAASRPVGDGEGEHAGYFVSCVRTATVRALHSPPSTSNERFCRHDVSYSAADDPADVLRRLKYLRPAHELRQQWSYNNQAWLPFFFCVMRETYKAFRCL